MDEDDKKPRGPRKPDNRRNAGGKAAGGGRAGFKGPRARPASRDGEAKSGGPRTFKDGARSPRSAGARPEGKSFGKRSFGKPAGEGRDGRFSEGGKSGAAPRGGKPFRSRDDAPPAPGKSAFRADRKPYEKRQRRDGQDRPPVGVEAVHGAAKPGRREREEPRGGDNFKPRSFASKGQGSRDDGSERKPRSFGMKRHASADAASDRKPRSHGMKEHAPPRRHGDGAPRSPAPRQMEAEAGNGERIAKRLARAGLASRREAEDLVNSGRVRVNGVVLQSAAVNVREHDRIEVDGTEIPAIERTRLFLFHKPAGVVTTNRDPQGRKTVFDVLPAALPRLMTVGRLDINTEGLLLLTNDGGLARVLELPATGWLRRYRVRVHGQVDETALAALKEGIAVEGVFYGAIEASLERVQGTNAWLSIGLREGKNREVKNVLGALGLEVNRLIRVSFGPFQLGELPEGGVQELKGRMLRDQLGERLIEEAGANFEAPVTTPFSSRSERSRHAEEHPVRQVRRPAALAQEPGEGGLIKGRRKRFDDRRGDALDRLSTRAPSFDKKPRGKPPREGDREAPSVSTAPRRANVWMAPGARPQGKKPEAGPKGPPRGGKGRPRGGRGS